MTANISKLFAERARSAAPSDHSATPTSGMVELNGNKTAISQIGNKKMDEAILIMRRSGIHSAAPAPEPVESQGLSWEQTKQLNKLKEDLVSSYKAQNVVIPHGHDNVKKTNSWSFSDYVNVNDLERMIKDTLGVDVKLKVNDASLKEVAEILNTEVVEPLGANPLGKTNENGIYLANDHPAYFHEGEDGAPDIDRIRSTIVHESLHAASHDAAGFQACKDGDTGRNNFDENVTDYFACQIFQKLYPESTYKTGYFIKVVGIKYHNDESGGRHKEDVTCTIWNGEFVDFMKQSDPDNFDAIKTAYFNTGKLPSFKSYEMEAWKKYTSNFNTANGKKNPS
ncbi:hypothetical protein [Chromobacterium sp. IIBBL 290-4]|uniref:hypothetical protein n=1 Tax=Chromobacterium sp. IIBBL 290-4 TaxID=2953890 RepID=UPI0020B85DB4|nr:hypothetical protein [Chromobacterium sp. IIBBL 290-4]UTH74109.1 hypothetical protein NKT35_21615 [Chromobacterium sp. IIBBL 290-4]